MNRKLKRVTKGKECLLDIHTVLFFLTLIFDYRVGFLSTNPGSNVNLLNIMELIDVSHKYTLQDLRIWQQDKIIKIQKNIREYCRVVV